MSLEAIGFLARGSCDDGLSPSWSFGRSDEQEVLIFDQSFLGFMAFFWENVLVEVRVWKCLFHFASPGRVQAWPFAADRLARCSDVAVDVLSWGCSLYGPMRVAWEFQRMLAKPIGLGTQDSQLPPNTES